MEVWAAMTAPEEATGEVQEAIMVLQEELIRMLPVGMALRIHTAEVVVTTEALELEENHRPGK